MLAAAEERFSHVGRNSAVMAVGTTSSRLLGFVRTAIFALIVADTASMNAFTQANNLPTTIYSIIATGVVTGILIPQIAKAMKQKDGGIDFINRLLTLSLLVVVVVTVVCTVGAPWLINVVVSSKADYNVPGYLHLAILLGYWCMPQILFYGLYAVLGQVLNARGHFTAYAWSPAWANIIQIAGLIWFWFQWGYQPDPAKWSTSMIVVLGASTTLGIAVQGLSLIWPLYKDGFRFKLRFGWRGYGFGDVSRMTMWTFTGVIIGALQSLLISRIANSMGASGEGYASNGTMQYASTLYILPISLIMVSIVTALYPAMANAWRAGDNDKMKDLVRQGLITPAVLVIPSSIAIIGLGAPLIHSLFGSGVNVGNIWLVTAAYCVGVWANAITTLKQRYYFAKQNGRLNFLLVLVPIVIQLAVAGGALLWVPAKYGVAFIAGGQSLGSIVAAGLFLWLVQREMGGYGFGNIAWLWAKVGVASVLAAGAGWGVVWLIDFADVTRMLALCQFFAGAVVFCFVFWGASAIMRVTEVTAMVHSVLARVLRRQVAAAEPIEDAQLPEQVDLVQTRVLDVLSEMPQSGPTPPPQPWLQYRQPKPPPQPWLLQTRPAPPPPAHEPTPPPQPWLQPRQPPQPWAKPAPRSGDAEPPVG